MGFFSSAVTTLQQLVVALGAGLGAWGVINLLEGYGNDNPGAKSQGIKQLMAGGGVVLVGWKNIAFTMDAFIVYVLAPLIGAGLAAIFFTKVIEPMQNSKNSCGCN